MSAIAKRNHRSRAQWQALLARAEHSELSVTEFCRRESVSTASFYTWRNRLRASAEPFPPAQEVGTDFIDLGTLGEVSAQGQVSQGQRAGSPISRPLTSTQNDLCTLRMP